MSSLRIMHSWMHLLSSSFTFEWTTTTMMTELITLLLAHARGVTITTTTTTTELITLLLAHAHRVRNIINRYTILHLEHFLRLVPGVPQVLQLSTSLSLYAIIHYCAIQVCGWAYAFSPTIEEVNSDNAVGWLPYKSLTSTQFNDSVCHAIFTHRLDFCQGSH